MLTALALATALMRPQGPEPVAAALERVRAKYGLPSICAGAILDGKVVSLDVVGVRRLGSDEKATVDDQYHCGSITKSFTAALVATYVQGGRLAWNTPLANLFPALRRDMDPAYARITPLHLVSQRSGLSGATWPPHGAEPLWSWKGEAPSPRAEYARLMLSKPPSYPPGSRFEYSNANFILLGAMLEGLTGSLWEGLLTTRILRPLGLKSAGFGPAGADGGSSQPWSHVMREGRLVAVPPGPGADNPPALGPAGTLHMSVPDLLKWCAFQADEGRNGGPLSPESFRTLHTPAFGGDYAGGLVVTQRAWAGGTALFHNGSNTMNYEVMWISPAKRFGVVVATNAAVDDVGNGLDEICALLIDRYCPK